MTTLDYNSIEAISYKSEINGESTFILSVYKFGRLMKETEKALCFFMRSYGAFGQTSEGNCWIPKSQIIEIIDGTAIVPEWLCKKIQLF